MRSMKVRLRLLLTGVLLLLCLVFPIVYYAVMTSSQIKALGTESVHAESMIKVFRELSEIKGRIESHLILLHYSRDLHRAEKVAAESKVFRRVVGELNNLSTPNRLLARSVTRYSEAQLEIVSVYLVIADLEIAAKDSELSVVRNRLGQLESRAAVYEAELLRDLQNTATVHTLEMERLLVYFLSLSASFLIAGIVLLLFQQRLLRLKVFKPLKLLSTELTDIRKGRRLRRLPEVLGSPEINELMQSFNEMSVDLEKNRQYRDIFSAITAHDLKEPLGAILSLVRLREMEIAEDPSADGRWIGDPNFIKRVELNAIMGLNMIDALLQLSRSSFQEITYEEIDLDSLVLRVFQDLKVFHFNKESTLKLEGSLGLVYADLRQVETLFRNLFSNSIKFGQPNRASVTIEIWSSTLSTDNVLFKEIHIRDDGVGFDSADYERLVRPFVRSMDESNDVKQESESHFMRGLGLGLAICSRVLENHRGHFTATSQLGVGSEFVLSFPVLGPEVLTATRAPRSGRLLY
jgi:signal transduction histidine kinase